MANIILLSELAKNLVEKLDEAQGEITAEIETAMNELANKGGAAIAPLCDIIDELTLRAQARKERAETYKKLAVRDEQTAETAKKTLKQIMTALGKEKFEVGALVVTLNKGKERVEVMSEDDVPDAYKRVTFKVEGRYANQVRSLLRDDVISEKSEVDKDKINKAHKNGIGVAGTIVIREPYVTIKG